MPVSSWSTTASSNATADAASGINWAEGMAASQVNDSARAMMAVVKSFYDTAWRTDNAPALGAPNGYQKLPSGMLIQWGGVASAGDTGVAFPTAFAGPLVIFTTPAAAEVTGTVLYSASVANLSTTGFTMYKRQLSGGVVSQTSASFYWLAIGTAP